jgi:uncharacterized membrane protein YkoI
MKNQYLITAALVTLPMVLGQANAGGKDLSKGQVPKAVIDAFEKAYPNAKSPEFETETFEGRAVYEVEYKENGKEYEALYSADGILVQTEEEIDVKSLSEPVVQAVNKTYPEANIKEAEKLMKPDGTLTGYEVEIKTEGKKFELELDVNGKILKTEKE